MKAERVDRPRHVSVRTAQGIAQGYQGCAALRVRSLARSRHAGPAGIPDMSSLNNLSVTQDSGGMILYNTYGVRTLQKKFEQELQMNIPMI